MVEKMNIDYFEEKKKMVLDGLNDAINNTKSSSELIKVWNYSMPGLTNPENIHELLQSAALQIQKARRDFEKVRWAVRKTDTEFEEWIKNGPGADLS